MYTLYLEIEEVYIIHDKMIEVGGGKSGVRDFGLLHSALERPKATFGGVDLYDTIWKKAGALLQSLVKNHPFDDGNKRTSFFSTFRFLEKNGYGLSITNKDIVSFVIRVDTENLTVEQIATWLENQAEKNPLYADN